MASILFRSGLRSITEAMRQDICLGLIVLVFEFMEFGQVLQEAALLVFLADGRQPFS